MMTLNLDEKTINAAVSDMIDASIRKYAVENYSNRIHSIITSIISEHEDELKDLIWGYLSETVKSEDMKQMIQAEYAKIIAETLVQRMKYKYD